MIRPGRDSDTPGEGPSLRPLTVRGLGLIVRRTVAEAWHDRIFGLSAEAGFWQLLSLPPLLLAVLGMVGFFASHLGPDTTNEIQSHILSASAHVLAPNVVSDVVQPLVSKVLAGGRADVVSIGFVISLWTGSSAMATYVNAITIAYYLRHQRSAWASRVLALGIYLLGVVAVAVVLPLMVLGPGAVTHLFPAAHLAVRVFYWPVVAIISLAAIATLYHLSVPVRTPWHRDLPGALVALVLWLAGSEGLRIYVTTVVSRESAYGQLGAVVAALLFMYITAFAVLFGAELNAEIDKLWPTPATAAARRREHAYVRELHERRGPYPEWERSTSTTGGAADPPDGLNRTD